MDYSRKLLPPMVSSAVALIVVTNYSMMTLLGSSASAAREVLPHFLSISLPTSAAVVLLMSSLYRALTEAVAELDRGQAALLQKAQKDALTGVASREHFEEELAAAITRYRETSEGFAVIMLDLDHFKRVNDLHGHPMGDALLKEVSQRIGTQLAPGDTVARLGGDEFIILHRGLLADEDTRSLCDKLCKVLSRPYELGNLQLRVSSSIGAVSACCESDCTSDYLRAADVALYDAKAQGRNCYRFFCEQLDENIRRRDQLETDLRSAIESGQQISVAFQPQIGSKGELIGVEALFRWKHPELGNIPALEAVGIAEETDLILQLGEFVFRRAAAFARDYPNLSVGINLSPAQFGHSGNLAECMRRLSFEESVNPEQIEFEITERLFMDIGGECDSQIQALRKEGFRIALDDFGTGYSSLSYLRRFQVDRLKLDKSFVDASEIQKSVAVVRAAVGLAHLLGLEVIAEGIETEEQEAVALESGCDALQGHYYGAPMYIEEFRRYLRSKSRYAA